MRLAAAFALGCAFILALILALIGLGPSIILAIILANP